MWLREGLGTDDNSSWARTGHSLLPWWACPANDDLYRAQTQKPWRSKISNKYVQRASSWDTSHRYIATSIRGGGGTAPGLALKTTILPKLEENDIDFVSDRKSKYWGPQIVWKPSRLTDPDACFACCWRMRARIVDRERSRDAVWENDPATSRQDVAIIAHTFGWRLWRFLTADLML